MANKVDARNKKENARLLFMQGEKTQLEIADLVGINKNTLSKWVVKEQWNLQKRSLIVSAEETLFWLYEQIEALREDIKKREGGNRLIGSKDADIIIKLTSAIDKFQVDHKMKEVFSVMKGFLDHIRSYDPEKAKEISGYVDMFVNHLCSKK